MTLPEPARCECGTVLSRHCGPLAPTCDLWCCPRCKTTQTADGHLKTVLGGQLRPDPPT